MSHRFHRSHQAGVVSPQLEFSSFRPDRPNDIVMTSQYLHMGTPVFDMSPINDRAPSISLRSTNGSTTAIGSYKASPRVDYSLEHLIEAPETSGTAEVFKSRRPGVSSYKHCSSSSTTRLRLRSLSLDDLSEYIGGSPERALSLYTNSVFQESPEGGAGGAEPKGDDGYPYSYATTPDFGLLRDREEKMNVVSEDNDGYCRPQGGLVSSLSNPNLLEDNGLYRRTPAANEGTNRARIRSIRHVIIGQQQQQNSRYAAGALDRVLNGSVSRSPAAGASISPPQRVAAETTKPTIDTAKGISATSKTRVFTRQKSAGALSPGPLTPLASSATPLSLSLSSGPPLMSFHAQGQGSNRSQRQLPELPTNGSASRVPHHSTSSRSKDETSFV